MKDVCGGLDNMTHTTKHLAHEPKVRQEGEEDKTNELSQGQGRKDQSDFLAKDTEFSTLFFVNNPASRSSLSQNHLR